ncbi:MAG: hypothetical protein SGI91_13385 [Alphaproteobacteria bacterium]|nr:hypothetical protein [Alphaproteobacteria bacterium]
MIGRGLQAVAILLACAWSIPALSAKNLCEPKHADASASAPVGSTATYVLIGVPQSPEIVVSVVISPYIPESRTLIYGGKSDPDCSVLFNIDKGSFVQKRDGRDYVFHLVEAVPQTYAFTSWWVRLESTYLICLADETYALDIKPGRINYIGKVAFKPLSSEIKSASRHGPGYRAVQHGAPFGIAGIDQNIDDVRADMAKYPGIALPIEKVVYRQATFATKENWLGTPLCYSTTERPAS